MKYPAQITCSLIFLSIVVKSFTKEVSYVDGIILLSVTSVYAMYEFIMNKKEKKELQEYKDKTDKHFKQLEEDIQNAKNYISKMTASNTLRR